MGSGFLVDASIKGGVFFFVDEMEGCWLWYCSSLLDKQCSSHRRWF